MLNFAAAWTPAEIIVYSSSEKNFATNVAPHEESDLTTTTCDVKFGRLIVNLNSMVERLVNVVSLLAPCHRCVLFLFVIDAMQEMGLDWLLQFVAVQSRTCEFLYVI